MYCLAVFGNINPGQLNFGRQLFPYKIQVCHIRVQFVITERFLQQPGNIVSLAFIAVPYRIIGRQNPFFKQIYGNTFPQKRFLNNSVFGCRCVQKLVDFF
jgi:hypothetical protein